MLTNLLVTCLSLDARSSGHSTSQRDWHATLFRVPSVVLAQ